MQIKKIVSAAFVSLALSSNAFAFKTCNDDWKFREDKQQHVAGSVVMAGVFNAFTDDPWKAFGASVAVGGTYELVTGCASLQDFGYDIIGSAIGAYVGYKVKNFIITPNKVVYSIQFN